MSKVISTMALFVVCVFLQILFVRCQTLAPALYVFGDSIYDHGNNKYLQTKARANYTPYGVDYTGGATGRFTNGKTFIDFIAEYLGLPTIPPYLSLSANDKIKMTTGVNYASGSAGILPETGQILGENLSFGKQIIYFRETFSGKRSTSTKDERLQLSKSIFLISIGDNDYINNYLKSLIYQSSKKYTPHQFADLLLDNLSNGLKILYELGGRKFVVFNIGRLGCIPAIVNSANPKPTSPCVESVNDMVSLYNTKLLEVIKQLESSLSGSTFVRGDAYGLNKTSAEAGFSAVTTPCCNAREDGQCVPNSSPCPRWKRNSEKVLFYDYFHPTETVNRIEASACFTGNSLCVPLNIKSLAEKQ